MPLVSIANELKASTELVHATAKRELEALGTYVFCVCFVDLCVCVAVEVVARLNRDRAHTWTYLQR